MSLNDYFTVLAQLDTKAQRQMEARVTHAMVMTVDEDLRCYILHFSKPYIPASWVEKLYNENCAFREQLTAITTKMQTDVVVGMCQ
jgi:hypothetical protein